MATWGRHGAVALFWLCLSWAWSKEAADAEPREACDRTLGFADDAAVEERLVRSEVGFCEEHHLATCCGKNETQRVFQRWAPSSQMQSERCASLTRQVLCSWCDAEVGTGLKAHDGNILICPQLCETWYLRCQGEYWSYVNEELVPCSSQVVCSTLSTILDYLPESERGAFFCSRAFAATEPHFEVAPVGAEPMGCFDGVPTATSRGLKASRAENMNKFNRRSTNPSKYQRWWREMENAFRHTFYAWKPVWKRISYVVGPTVLVALAIIVITVFVLRR